VNAVCTSSGEHTVLHWAIMCGNIQAIQDICSIPGVNLGKKNTRGETPVNMAMSKNMNRGIVRMLGRDRERQRERERVERVERERRDHQQNEERMRVLEREARELTELQESVMRMAQVTQRIIGEIERLEIGSSDDEDEEATRDREERVEEVIRDVNEEEPIFRSALQLAGNCKSSEYKIDKSEEEIAEKKRVTDTDETDLKETVDTISKTVDDKIEEISSRIEKLDHKILQRGKCSKSLSGEDRDLVKLKSQKQELSQHLSKLAAKPQILPCPECPVCLDSMKPPMRILQCVSGHLVCEGCSRKMKKVFCPTCKKDLSGRATAMEQFLRTLFNPQS